MKFFRVFAVTALVLPFLFISIGCTHDPDPVSPASMKFEKEDHSAEFTINEKFEFNVKFLEDGGFGDIIRTGNTVSGKIKNASPGTWNADFEGTAYSMSSNNFVVNAGVGAMEIKISLTYEDNKLSVEFPDKNTSDPTDPSFQAHMLMGGKYTKK